MSVISTEVNISKIMMLDSFNARIIGIISMMEGYYYSISKKIFRSIKSSKLEDVTLSELSLAYNNSMKNNMGMHGVCWEYYIYNLIANNDDFVINTLNYAINGINILEENKKYDKIEVILWGGEKKNLNLFEILNSINNDDFLWCYNRKIPFKSNLQLILNSFSNDEIRNTLYTEFSSVWKADMFIKKSSSDMWYAVSVKWKKSQLKLNDYNGLSIGIAFEDDFSNTNYQNVEFIAPINETNIKANCIIPFTCNLGQYFTDTFRLFNTILEHLNSTNSSSYSLYFPTYQERCFFEYLRNNKYARCSDMINYLREIYYVDEKHVETKSIILATEKELLTEPNSKTIVDNRIVNFPIMTRIEN